MIYFLGAVNRSGRIRFVRAISQIGENKSPTSKGHHDRLSITLKQKTSTRSLDGAAFLGLRTPRSNNTHSIKNNLRTLARDWISTKTSFDSLDKFRVFEMRLYAIRYEIL